MTMHRTDEPANPYGERPATPAHHVPDAPVTDGRVPGAPAPDNRFPEGFFRDEPAAAPAAPFAPASFPSPYPAPDAYGAPAQPGHSDLPGQPVDHHADQHAAHPTMQLGQPAPSHPTMQLSQPAPGHPTMQLDPQVPSPRPPYPGPQPSHRTPPMPSAPPVPPAVPAVAPVVPLAGGGLPDATMQLTVVPAAGAAAPQQPRSPQPQPPVSEPEPESESAKAGRTARNGMIMALGSLSSRALGFVRAAVIAAAIGVAGVGDGYAVATMLPNTIFIMLIGGVLNSVFVPELVRAAQQHADRGVAYTNRLLTVCGVVLIGITAVAFVCAPMIVDAYTNYGPNDTAQRELTLALARYCLPAVLFYGLFGLLGQVLNSRDRFGAMMWAPVLNNVIVIAVFSLYMVLFDFAKTADDVSGGAAMLLGLGSAFGILVQALALLPSLRASGFRYRPRFDWRGSGLTAPLRAAGWALMLVVVTQLCFLGITNLATGALAKAAEDGLTGIGLGYTAYNNAYLLFIVPQGIITVSLVTAILPGMSRSVTAGRFTEVGRELAQTLRSSAGMIVPASAVFLALATPIARLAYGHGNVAAADVEVIAQVLMAFAIGLPAFCAQYALARGFYAMSDARTPFWLTTVISGSNVALSGVAFLLLPSRWIIVGMAGAHTLAVLLGVAITGRALGRRLRREGAAAPAAPTPADLPPDATLILNTGLNTGAAAGRRAPVRSGLDGARVVVLHLALALACAPGALAAYWLTGLVSDLIPNEVIAALLSLGTGSLLILASVLLLARPLGAATAVGPLARKLRIPYPTPAPAPAAPGNGKHRR
ncbi:murein biosynthesis integral membrane protein MurJ [Kitasatospora sp. NPDC051853]|uniref:murein biosynthesis integral membrane protein MurJ n=1 Tax=Kitasatospora sp. NPDC051853 TaxID=3364058 RepID=UPI0037A2D2C7